MIGFGGAFDLNFSLSVHEYERENVGGLQHLLREADVACDYLVFVVRSEGFSTFDEEGNSAALRNQLSFAFDLNASNKQFQAVFT